MSRNSVASAKVRRIFGGMIVSVGSSRHSRGLGRKRGTDAR